MSESDRTRQELEDDLAPLVDGEPDVVQRYADRLAASDALRDLRHEASQAADRVAEAGADFEVPPDLSARVLAAIDAVQGGEAAHAADTHAATTDTHAATTDTHAATTDTHAATTDTHAATADTHAATTEQGAPADAPSARAKRHSRAPVVAVLGVATLLAAAAVALLAVGSALWLHSRHGTAPSSATADGAGALGGHIARLARAAAGGPSGVEVRLPHATAFVPGRPSQSLPPGTSLRTDDRTRARIALTDGSTVTLAHDTEVTLVATAPRRLQLVQGEIVADVAHLAHGPHAVYATPQGRVEVLGTEIVLAATSDLTSLQVVRGEARLVAAGGGVAGVRAGQEGVLSHGEPPSVGPFTHLANAVAWSELDPPSADEDLPMPGIGELTAHRPGKRDAHDRSLTLANHRVDVRIVGNVARTEVEETFRNDSGDTLEGVYRFPMPSDARIASLALLVHGTWQEGAFVDRERAAKIFRGVVRHATPAPERTRDQEYIWVQGPWRDPALLEWQRGGRFELRIFPIPAHGARQVRIAYTQTVTPEGDHRHYVYPLAHRSDDSLQIGHFDVKVHVADPDGDASVSAHGYVMSKSGDGRAQVLAFAKDHFVPAGDLVVDYREPRSEAALSYWTFRGDATAATPAHSREVSPEVLAAWRALHDDGRPYVAFALRPRLPAWTESHARDYVLVVDSSQSMFGERYDRASQLATAVVAQMDRRDRFVLVACDLDCRAMQEAPEPPAGRAPDAVRAWLHGIRPAGSSDVVASLRRAAAIARQSGSDRDLRVIYIGDGASSVGHRRVSAISAEVEDMAQGPRLTFTTVGIGDDADAQALAAVARAGGGHYLPYVPGQRENDAALSVLETTYGVSLDDATIEMPEGVTDVAPARLPTIRDGEEVVVVGRMASDTIRGQVVLSGKVGGHSWKDRYPVTLTATTSQGNAFVPRLWATKTIEEADLSGTGADRDRIVAMSKGFGVLSRETSLLVLESPAMFRAYGIRSHRPGGAVDGRGGYAGGPVRGPRFERGRRRGPGVERGLHAPGGPRRARRTHAPRRARRASRRGLGQRWGRRRCGGEPLRRERRDPDTTAPAHQRSGRASLGPPHASRLVPGGRGAHRRGAAALRPGRGVAGRARPRRRARQPRPSTRPGARPVASR